MFRGNALKPNVNDARSGVDKSSVSLELSGVVSVSVSDDRKSSAAHRFDATKMYSSAESLLVGSF
jgi:hypothetical protein